GCGLEIEAVVLHLLADPVDEDAVRAGEPLGGPADLRDLRLDPRDPVAPLDEGLGHRLLPAHEDADSLRHVFSLRARARRGPAILCRTTRESAGGFKAP